MAHVKNVRLRMGRRDSRIEFAEVAFDVDFSARELAERLTFGLHIHLFEVDGDRDIYVWTPNGPNSIDYQVHRSELKVIPDPDDRDDDITTIVQTTIVPNGQATQHFVQRKDFDLGNQEDGNEQYEAYVLVVPEVVQGYARSNRVDINLG
jgi:hypothetical protein